MLLLKNININKGEVTHSILPGMPEIFLTWGQTGHFGAKCFNLSTKRTKLIIKLFIVQCMVYYCCSILFMIIIGVSGVLPAGVEGSILARFFSSTNLKHNDAFRAVLGVFGALG